MYIANCLSSILSFSKLMYLEDTLLGILGNVRDVSVDHQLEEVEDEVGALAKDVVCLAAVLLEALVVHT